jgi:hypothetical protein
MRLLLRESLQHCDGGTELRRIAGGEPMGENLGSRKVGEIVPGVWIEIYRAAEDTALRMKTYCCVKPTDKSLFVKSDG